MTDKNGRPYFHCEHCADDGSCMVWGHPCGCMICNEKLDEYQPDEDTEV